SNDRGYVGISPFAGLNAMKVFLQYQASMLRVWANNCELAAHNFGRGLEPVRSARDSRGYQSSHETPLETVEGTAGGAGAVANRLLKARSAQMAFVTADENAAKRRPGRTTRS